MAWLLPAIFAIMDTSPQSTIQSEARTSFIMYVDFFVAPGFSCGHCQSVMHVKLMQKHTHDYCIFGSVDSSSCPSCTVWTDLPSALSLIPHIMGNKLPISLFEYWAIARRNFANAEYLHSGLPSN